MTNNFFVSLINAPMSTLGLNELGIITLPESKPFLQIQLQKEVITLLYSLESYGQVQACASQGVADENHAFNQGRTTAMVRRNTMDRSTTPGSKRPVHFREKDHDLFIGEEENSSIMYNILSYFTQTIKLSSKGEMK